ncbi:hypothetical protein DWF04_000865 [Cereibacter sphaeroides f. sp. denitrificans]|nr:hypothetical protein DWF04_13295 [Cereibacter sphaeroides f. sp. denitrificans]
MAQTPPERPTEERVPPADSAGNTTDRLRHDIDRGGAADKVSFMDPAAAPLGTDDEAAGTPPSPEQIARAREMEARPTDRSANASSQSRTVGELAGNQERRGMRPILIFGGIMIVVVILVVAL